MTAKFERLQQLARHVDFSALIPPLLAFPADKAFAITAVSPHADAELLRTIYSKYITEHHDWVKQVEEVCGPPPWIVRSAGLEDGDIFVNARIYCINILLLVNKQRSCVSEMKHWQNLLNTMNNWSRSSVISPA
ncbi:hypothetical protein [Photorhabdus laumondii]|uniref:Uncharacterized protein n=1 Tax=Photorhabdus laumondii subsp. clarkei TaxID=2029685 RepID=A0A329VD25_9GAMM|nr:hypothetical protein [Photorhabdus laumondii]PQQ36004.1 hypothetical protein C6H68_21550 [Photorhabdus luminescens]RAW83235.1 hypothetical protein CKY01_21370 [Photorhabdus laumondii subsp. clarkei]